MASLFPKSNGSWAIDFDDAAAKRRRLSIGKLSKRDAGRFLEKFEQLQTTRAAGLPLSPAMSEWALGLSDDLKAKLARFGLLDLPRSYCREEWIDEYIASRTDAKDSTSTKWKTVRDR